jgi:hypothetical protein
VTPVIFPPGQLRLATDRLTQPVFDLPLILAVHRSCRERLDSRKR